MMSRTLYTLYAIHRWTSLAAIIQLGIWTATGLFFAVTPLQRVRGEDRLAGSSDAPIAWSRVAAVAPPTLQGAAEVTVRMLDGRPVFVAREGERRWLVDAHTGAEIAIDAEAAGRIARADQLGAPAVQAVTRIESAPIEYRGRPLPAWRVDLADGRATQIYVDALTGAVTARRNGLWRVYDFLWGLHIMDYGGRENFNNALLAAFAILGIATWATGATVWLVRARRALRR